MIDRAFNLMARVPLIMFSGGLELVEQTLHEFRMAIHRGAVIIPLPGPRLGSNPPVSPGTTAPLPLEDPPNVPSIPRAPPAPSEPARPRHVVSAPVREIHPEHRPSPTNPKAAARSRPSHRITPVFRDFFYDPNITPLEDTNMSDQGFYESNATITFYQVVFIKRDWEELLQKETCLVTSTMESNGFAAWKVAEFVQAMERCDIELPQKWVECRDEFPGKGNYKEKGGKFYLVGLREDDKKYLRVTYQILDVVTREEPEYDKDKTKAFEKIASALKGTLKVEKVP